MQVDGLFFLFAGVPKRLVDYKRFGYGKSEFESETESVWVELHYGNVLGNTVQYS